MNKFAKASAPVRWPGPGGRPDCRCWGCGAASAHRPDAGGGLRGFRKGRADGNAVCSSHGLPRRCAKSDPTGERPPSHRRSDERCSKRVVVTYPFIRFSIQAVTRSRSTTFRTAVSYTSMVRQGHQGLAYEGHRTSRSLELFITLWPCTDPY